MEHRVQPAPRSSQLRTQRCLLRPSGPSDAVWIASAVGDARYPADDPWSVVDSVEDARDRLEVQSKCWGERTAFHFTIELLGAPPHAGQVSLSREPEPNTWLLGYWLVPDVWGSGIATECATATVHLAFTELGAHSLWAGVTPHNHRSLRVLSKLGFEYRNSNPAGYTVDGKPIPNDEYELVRERAA